MKKTCSKCKKNYSILDFYLDYRSSDGKASSCKFCAKVWRNKNKNYIKKYNKEYKIKNREKLSKLSLSYYYKNKEKISKQIKNRKRCPKRKLIHKARVAAWRLFKRKKTNKTVDIIGCNYDFFINYLWLKFEYTYGIPRNYVSVNDLELDHIIPLSSGETKEDLYKLGHYTNLQLLFKQDNRIKSNKMVEST